jgi:thioredoxin-dependent peroxiredoxin
MARKKLDSFNFILVAVLTLVAAFMGLNKVMASSKEVKVGDKAPDFSLPSQDGSPVSLQDFAGKKNVVLYFYPKDNTPVCTKEACSFRDAFKDFTDAGAEVIGVSSDSEKSHQGFASEHKLPFKLLSDENAKIRKLYGVPLSMGVLPGRVTYVIDKKGIVRMMFNSQLDSQKHVSEALRVLKDLENGKGQG